MSLINNTSNRLPGNMSTNIPSQNNPLLLNQQQHQQRPDSWVGGGGGLSDLNNRQNSNMYNSAMGHASVMGMPSQHQHQQQQQQQQLHIQQQQQLTSQHHHHHQQQNPNANLMNGLTTNNNPLVYQNQSLPQRANMLAPVTATASSFGAANSVMTPRNMPNGVLINNSTVAPSSNPGVYQQPQSYGLGPQPQQTPLSNMMPTVPHHQHHHQQQQQHSLPDQLSYSSGVDLEFQEALEKNRIVSSSAISRAVQDASLGHYGTAVETLVTAMSLIKQSKCAQDERCKLFVASLQDTKKSIEDKYYQLSGMVVERDRDRDRDRERERERDRARDRERDRDRGDRRVVDQSSLLSERLGGDGHHRSKRTGTRSRSNSRHRSGRGGARPDSRERDSHHRDRESGGRSSNSRRGGEKHRSSHHRSRSRERLGGPEGAGEYYDDGLMMEQGASSRYHHSSRSSRH